MLVGIIVTLNVPLQQPCDAQDTACRPWTSAAYMAVLRKLRNGYL